MKMPQKFYNIIILCVISSFIIFLTRIKYNFEDHGIPVEHNHVSDYQNTTLDHGKRMKYILVWSELSSDPLLEFNEGTTMFEQRQCAYTNCYITYKKDYIMVAFFDVNIFNVMDGIELPHLRSGHQKYIFASSESSANNPLCSVNLNNFFNWTWTYKLNSDLVYNHIIVKNKEGKVIGPREEMKWKNVQEMEPIDKVLKKKLSTKKYAAAWFATDCYPPVKKVVEQLSIELEQHDLILDTYGACSVKRCPGNNITNCLKMLEDYYFYLSFEESFSTDYVTEKLLYPLQHYAVPIVYGDAKYSRFMPQGIYLDANILSIPELAKQMAELINDKEKYYTYFKWHNYYSYHDGHDRSASDTYCELCSMINNEIIFKTTSVYGNFLFWWNDEENTCRQMLASQPT